MIVSFFFPKISSYSTFFWFPPSSKETGVDGCILVPLVQIDISLLADQVGVSATDTLDLGQGVHDLLLAINVGVQKTQDLEQLNVSLQKSFRFSNIVPPHRSKKKYPRCPEICSVESMTFDPSRKIFVANGTPSLECEQGE